MRRMWVFNLEGFFLRVDWLGEWQTLYHKVEVSSYLFETANLVIIRSGNGLAQVWCQAIIYICADLSSSGPIGTNFSEIRIKLQQFSNAFENAVGKISAISSKSQCIKSAVLHPGYRNNSIGKVSLVLKL